MAQQSVYLTPEGLKRLQEELEYLKTVRRREVAEQIRKAVEVGGDVDNAEYDEAKREQARVEGRILELENLLKHAVVVSEAERVPGQVGVGSRVTLQDLSTGREMAFTVVGSMEADPAHGKLSYESPVGRALMGRHQGEEVEVRTPKGVLRYRILRVE